jgi:hypothetical protein
MEWFVNTLRRRHLTNGILVAQSGISGYFSRDAGRIVMEALSEGIGVVVVTGSELTQVTSNHPFTELVKTKYCRLFMGKSV